MVENNAQTPVTSSSEVGWLWRKHSGLRVGTGSAARIEGSRRLLECHQAYFAKHRRARAFGGICRDTGPAR